MLKFTTRKYWHMKMKNNITTFAQSGAPKGRSRSAGLIATMSFDFAQDERGEL
jgi:hypothetical protein